MTRITCETCDSLSLLVAYLREQIARLTTERDHLTYQLAVEREREEATKEGASHAD